MFASGSPGQPITQVLKAVQSSADICQEQQAAQETNRRERTDSSSSTPPQKAQGRERLNYLLEQRIHTGKGKGKGFSVSGQDKGKSDCEPDSISAMFYQLCTIL